MEPGQQIELTITDLNHNGEGVGRHEERVVFVPDPAPGDYLRVKILQIKKNYLLGQCLEILQPSPERTRPACIVADKCGGCQWQHLSLAEQRRIKQAQLKQTLERIGQFQDLPLQPLLGNDQGLAYRNKATYPLGRSTTGQVQAGYYQRQSHRLINLNQCPVQDSRLDLLLKEIKADIQFQGWSIYDESQRRGKLRHLSLRIGRRTGEMLLTLVSAQPSLTNLQPQAEIWLQRYPDLVGVALNLQPQPHNVIFGPETRIIAGRGSCREVFAGLTFELAPDTFFQVNTEVAEALLEAVFAQLDFSRYQFLVDAYCGVGAFTLPLAQRAQSGAQVMGMENNPQSIQQARHNGELNLLTDVLFWEGTVAEGLAQLETAPDFVLLDPPRKGLDRPVLDQLLHWSPQTLVYISCEPATLARDLHILGTEGDYRPVWIQGADFFPQTRHVECAVILERLGLNIEGQSDPSNP
ncbi:MAG: 23S rRNA (uracil(1939)-C(5))-methyltransferase RlmD [Cyanobacteriota bacterium]